MVVNDSWMIDDSCHHPRHLYFISEIVLCGFGPILLLGFPIRSVYFGSDIYFDSVIGSSTIVTVRRKGPYINLFRTQVQMTLTTGDRRKCKYKTKDPFLFIFIVKGTVGVN